MKVKLILPALTEARSPYWRSIKYSLFPPLGLATLAGYLNDEDEVEIRDEHVEKLNLDDRPDLVGIEVYITSAYRAYKVADHYHRKGCYVALGGLHITSMPEEAKLHADTIFLGPGEDTWPQFLSDFRAGRPRKVYHSKKRSLLGTPKIRRDLIKHHLYLAPNSIVVSKGCPHNCDFCYKEAFFKGGKSFYTQAVDEALAEIERLPGKHLFFLDDHLFGNVDFAMSLFEGMCGMRRLWQAAGTVSSVLKPGLLEKAVQSGLRSLFIGFESINSSNLKEHNKFHNLIHTYEEAIRRLRDNGVMINASFIFGMDGDDRSVFERTVEWAAEHGIETVTFHILTPYPGTRLYKRMESQRRLLTKNWDLYDTRHAVFQPAKMTLQELEDGYWKSYEDFYSWSSIFKSSFSKKTAVECIRHLIYTAGWKKFERFWRIAIKVRQVNKMLPLLETILAGFGVFSHPRTTRNFEQTVSPEIKIPEIV
jgi:radical SAM superfamily enzyme YgiQ (UPF0313 family)